MTKKILLKWLEEQKVKALAQVDTQENAAKATLLAEKLERTKFAEMVAYVEPRLTEVYDYMMDWHKKNEELAGPPVYELGYNPVLNSKRISCAGP